PPPDHDHGGQRALLAAALVELPLHAFERPQRAGQLARLAPLPVLLWREPHARALRAAARVGAAERRRSRPGSRDQARDAQATSEDLLLQGGDVARVQR